MKQLFIINDFEGPLDLLLHLIKENKMDIMDFEITTIINQFLEMIDAAKNINLEIASEFLVMASTLVEVKSKLLLPKPEIEIDLEYEEESKEALVERLLEYKRYKELTSVFKQYNEERSLIYTKPVENLNQFVKTEKKVDLPNNLDLYDLIKSLDKMMKRVSKTQSINSIMKNDEISVEARSLEVLNLVKRYNKAKIPFINLININTKSYLIVTFLAVLDLAKKQKIIIIQDKILDEIYVEEVI
ncbi:segregation/condensation protein A [Mycoplasma sp. P36-A1]|uniref:segregation/condensation protein A n=1 Tax=Mycoplasma sp. P36-A1 TaxID=3252900 RepID=UPI003C2DA34D